VKTTACVDAAAWAHPDRDLHHPISPLSFCSLIIAAALEVCAGESGEISSCDEACKEVIVPAGGFTF
jgi:hypothetical protein